MALSRKSPEVSSNINEELSLMAQRHVASSEGSLALLGSDPDRYPEQSEYHVKGEPLDEAVINILAETVEPRFNALLDLINQAESGDRKEVSRINEQFKNRDNLIIVTNHGDLIDIALVEAAFYSIFKKAEMTFNTSIIISKMVTMLGYKMGNDIIPCTDVLKMLCDDIFLSFPRSETIEKAAFMRLVPDEIDRHNKLVRKSIGKLLMEGSNLMALAPSGSKDKEISENHYRLGPINPGTIAIMRFERTFVLPVAVWLKSDQPFFKICDIPRKIQSDEEVHGMMETIAKVLSDNVDGNFSYAIPEATGKSLFRNK